MLERHFVGSSPLPPCFLSSPEDGVLARFRVHHVVAQLVEILMIRLRLEMCIGHWSESQKLNRQQCHKRWLNSWPRLHVDNNKHKEEI